jgi:DNA-directed RNA polymerase specialized sigma subunit
MDPIGKKNEEMALFDAWKAAPGPATLTPLVGRLDPIVNKALGAYGYSGDANMKSTARLLAIQALPKYDPSKAALDTFVFGELRRLQRIGPQQEHAIPIPERVILERRIVERTTDELQEELGRPPTDDELLDRTGLSNKRLRTLRAAHGEVVGPRRDEAGQVIADATDTSDGSGLWEAAVVDSLDPVDRKIYEWSTGSGGERMTKLQMAQRLRLSPAAITQRSSRIARLLRSGEGMQV